jgi:hypothetical protein
MVKAPSIKMQVYLFEGLFFKESILGQKKKYMCVSDCMVFKIRVGSSGFFFVFLKPTSMLLPLKSHKLVCFFLTTAY